MKKLLSSLATLTLVASTTSGTVVACGSRTTTAQQESDQVNNKNMTLNDNDTTTYENKTAQQDATAIENAFFDAGYLNATQVKDFTFNDTTKIKLGSNTVNYSVRASDNSTATGSFNLTIKHPASPFTPSVPPTPTPKIPASKINKSMPTTAKKEHDLINGNNVTLNDTASLVYEGKTVAADKLAIDQAIMTAGYLNATQLKDFTFNNSSAVLTTGMNVINYTINAADGSKMTGTFNVTINHPAVPLNPSTSSTAKKESDQVNNKSITLNDTASATYENKTAQQDMQAIDNALVTAGYLNTTQVKDFSFDNTTTLKPMKNSVKYNVIAPDGSTANGTLNVTINHPAVPLTPSEKKASTIVPSTPTTAKKESDQVNNKSITLNDTASATYENKTAAQDALAIDNAITTAGYLSTTQVKDLSFDSTTALKASTNAVKYNVKAPDGSTASGTLNVTINPYKPTPPTPSTAQQEANKVNNQTVTLNDSSTTKYEDQTAQQDVTAIDNAIVTAGYLNATQVKDFSFDNSKNLTTGTNTGVSFNVNAPDKSTAKGSFNIVINPYKPTPPTPGTGGLGKSKSVPFLDVTSVSSGINDLTPDKVYNTFGVHQVMLAFVSAYDNTGASWVQGVKFDDMSTSEAK